MKQVSFYKYVALGNDFILLDFYLKGAEEVEKMLKGKHWPHFVQSLCHRKLGIGADGVLIVYQKNHQAYSKIFNQDGSDGEFCGNGVRAIAHFLKTYHAFPAQFLIEMGKKSVRCEVESDVATAIDMGSYLGESEINVEGNWRGARLNVGNPHLIIFAEVTPLWLITHGGRLETYFGEDQKTNVEFVFEIAPMQYQMLIFERGVGYSEACASGAMALTQLLYERGEIKTGQAITIKMPGGMVKTCIKENRIYLTAEVSLVFIGEISISPSSKF